MAKKVKAVITLQIQAGKATPAPPIGPALASQGINIMQFTKEYNARTSGRMGQVIPAKITVFSDGSFTFILKTPPAAILLKERVARSQAVGIGLALIAIIFLTI